MTRHRPALALLLCLVCAGLVAAPGAGAGGTVEPWPAEAERAADNLTALNADFGVDLSGVFWNEQIGVLWAERNGPTDTTSKLWSLARGHDGSFAVTGQWVGLGDLEDVTQADLDACTVYGIVEGDEQRVKEWNVCQGQPTPVLANDWDTKVDIPQAR